MIKENCLLGFSIGLIMGCLWS